MNHSPKVSIVIPIKNEGLKIKKCLDGILEQTYKNIEIIIVDSGSTDNTLEIISNYDLKLIQIKPNEFNHGLTRNLGIQHASGEFVILTVGDAYPSTNTWIEIMLKQFSDKNVAGVCGQQIVPHDLDKNPLEWFRPQSEPKPQKIWFEKEKFTSLSRKDRFKFCAWDDVSAMYRTKIIKEIPFRETNFSEDALWAHDALLNAHALVYEYNARVYHYHKYNFKANFRRRYTVEHHIFQFFQKRVHTEFFIFLIMKIFYRIFFKSYVKEKSLYWFFYNFSLVISSKLANWLFFINSILLKKESLEKAHKFWVGKAPQPLR